MPFLFLPERFDSQSKCLCSSFFVQTELHPTASIPLFYSKLQETAVAENLFLVHNYDAKKGIRLQNSVIRLQDSVIRWRNSVIRLQHSEDHSKHSEDHSKHSEDHSKHSEDHSKHSEDHSKHSEDHSKHSEDHSKHSEDHLKHSEDRLKHSEARLKAGFTGLRAKTAQIDQFYVLWAGSPCFLYSKKSCQKYL